MLRVALAQINPVVGDFAGNIDLITRAIRDATEKGADLVAFPELAVTGYPPEDLLFKRGFIDDNLAALKSLAASVSGIAVVVGYVEPEQRLLYNAAAVIADGRVVGSYRKHHLPNYGVFDERRYFHAGERVTLLSLARTSLGITICEDLWDDDGPHSVCRDAGAQWILNINASPYHKGKGQERAALVRRRAQDLGVGFLYVNLVGGQDELVFDGQSFAVDSAGNLIARASQFRPETLFVDLPTADGETMHSAPQDSRIAETGSTASVEGPGAGAAASGSRPGIAAAGGSGRIDRVDLAHPARHVSFSIRPRVARELRQEGEVYEALVLGVRDYLRKNGFAQAMVGISGGIDSALTATIAVDAIGRRNVLGVSNPSRYTSPRSVTDARQLAANLGIKLEIIPIEDAFAAMRKALDPVFDGGQEQLAEENLQARIRGALWMAISNQSGRIVLSTGNKSELAVGYATLYGDMAGGFAVLKDVPKTLVYRLAIWRNTAKRLIPMEILDRPPTAELRPGQLDTDSLPPYGVLDPILEAYIQEDLPAENIAALGFDRAIVDRVIEMVDRAEYKRRQAPPGIKVTDRAFGRDRRLPITNRYRS